MPETEEKKKSIPLNNSEAVMNLIRQKVNPGDVAKENKELKKQEDKDANTAMSQYTTGTSQLNRGDFSYMLNAVDQAREYLEKMSGQNVNATDPDVLARQIINAVDAIARGGSLTKEIIDNTVSAVRILGGNTDYTKLTLESALRYGPGMTANINDTRYMFAPGIYWNGGVNDKDFYSRQDGETKNKLTELQKDAGMSQYTPNYSDDDRNNNMAYAQYIDAAKKTMGKARNQRLNGFWDAALHGKVTLGDYIKSNKQIDPTDKLLEPLIAEAYSMYNQTGYEQYKTYAEKTLFPNLELRFDVNNSDPMIAARNRKAYMNQILKLVSMANSNGGPYMRKDITQELRQGIAIMDGWMKEYQANQLEKKVAKGKSEQSGQSDKNTNNGGDK